MEDTLYISDLDGTLLRSDGKLSPYSLAAVNRLVGLGMRFSYATARSLATSAKVTAGLSTGVLAIVNNGAFILNARTGEIVRSNFFSAADYRYAGTLLLRLGIYPVVHAFFGGAEKFVYHTGHIGRGLRVFLDERRGDRRARPVADDAALLMGDGFCFTCIGGEEAGALLQAYETLRGDARFHCIYERDFYTREPWLEVLPAQATKASAALQLREIYGCGRIVSFGDGKNDLELFGVSDECYAVRNASPELKALASGIIGGNDEDGVARWLERHALLPNGG